MKLFLLFSCIFLEASFLHAQDTLFRRPTHTIYPSLSYQPETGYQFGLHGLFFFDLDRLDTLSRRSKLDGRLYYTTKDQYYTYDLWQIFTKDEKYNISGQFQAGYWIDRYYSVGRPGRQVIEYYQGVADTANYFNYAYHFIDFYTIIDRRIFNNLFGGMVLEYDKSGENQLLADSLNRSSDRALKRNDATRAGIGVNLNFDSRDNCDNPSRGAYVQFISAAYRKEFGGTTDYHIFTLDADRYIHTFKGQVLALRVVLENRKADGSDPIPIRGLSYNGGISSLRGYYAGSYRDNNLVAVETEYRLPICIRDNAPFWKFWERVGVVGFFSGVRVSNRFDNLVSTSLNDYHFAGGMGLRYMINMKQRLNATMDYAVGFDKVAGFGQRTRGIYFSLGEAF